VLLVGGRLEGRKEEPQITNDPVFLDGENIVVVKRGTQGIFIGKKDQYGEKQDAKGMFFQERVQVDFGFT
jgi:hypothetical protein